MTVRARAAAAAAAAPARHSQPAPASQPTRRPQGRPRAAARRRRLRMGGLAIPLTAVMLGGIVWLNVAKLQLTNRVSQTQNATLAVQADTARLRAAISRRDNSVLAEAKRRLNMALPAEDAVTFVRAPRP